MIINNLNKYNEPLVVKARITREAIENVLRHDGQIRGPPKFIADFLKGLPSQHRETSLLQPSLIAWSNDYLILPNPDQSSHEQLMENPMLAKDNSEGLGLIAWYIHSKYKHVQAKQDGGSPRYGTYHTKEQLVSHRRINSWSQLRERDANAEKVGSLDGYISGPFDYNVTHFESLKQLRIDVLKHLRTEYGITEQDHVDLYFHTHYSVCTTTAHLHIRVNQHRHGLELDKSISLDKIIELLEQDVSSETPVIDEYVRRKYVHKELKSLQFLKSNGFNTEIVWNPYYVRCEDKVSTKKSPYWDEYFKSVNESIGENFYSSLRSYNEAKSLGDPYIPQLEAMGYSFELGNEYPAPFEKSLEWIAQNSQVFQPAKAFLLPPDNKVLFVTVGGDVPVGATPAHILSPDDFVLMLSTGYFPIGEAIREHTNQSIAEHDLAHMAGFVSNPHFAKCVQNAFRKVLIKMQTNPKLCEALTNFNSVYSTRLYYMIEIFTCISDEHLMNLLIDIPDWRDINCNAENISTILLEKSRDPVAFARYLQRLYGNFLRYVNPLGGESRDILNRQRKFSRGLVTGIYDKPGRSRFAGQSLYSLYLNGLAALENKRSTHPDYQQSIIEIHTPFIGALLGTAKLSVDNWVLDTVEEVPNTDSPIYKYLYDSDLWDHEHPLVRAFCDPNYTKVIN
ncbi:Hypothetical protein HVR_LOCUS940 [uncultured virus]|nr:Hypothetical protein HVR_LOCUS940 [uncultured virus]